jgi:hypothetical protein
MPEPERDLAAHLVDDVLPEVPLRQWVCSLPWSVRTALAYDRELCADVLAAFARALERSYRKRAKRALALPSTASALFGAVTVIQRSDSALRVDPHFHTLALDGVHVRDPSGALVFRIFNSDALALIHEQSQGRLRDTDRIATDALKLGSRRKIKTIDRELVARVPGDAEPLGDD